MDEANDARRSSGKALETKTDKSIVAVKVVQVDDEESTIEVLVDTPKKHKTRKERSWIDGGLLRAPIESTGSTNGTVSEMEKKETEWVFPTLYDYQTLSTMQRCFQRWRPLASLDERDGEAFGKMLMENTSKLFDVKERSEKSRREKFEWFVGEQSKRASHSYTRRGNHKCIIGECRRSAPRCSLSVPLSLL